MFDFHLSNSPYTKCPPNPGRKSVGTVRGVDGCTWTTTKRVTTVSTTTLIPSNRKTVHTVAVKDTLSANRDSYVVIARMGGCIRSD